MKASLLNICEAVALNFIRKSPCGLPVLSAVAKRFRHDGGLSRLRTLARGRRHHRHRRLLPLPVCRPSRAGKVRPRRRGQVHHRARPDSDGFCTDREDVNSLSLTVLDRLVTKYGLAYADIGRLEVGTETLVDKSKSVKSVLMQVSTAGLN